MKSWYSIIIYQEVLPVFVVIASAVFWIRNIFKVMRENSAPPPLPAAVRREEHKDLNKGLVLAPLVRASVQGRAHIPRHTIGYPLTRDTSVANALDEVASNICQALPASAPKSAGTAISPNTRD